MRYYLLKDLKPYFGGVFYGLEDVAEAVLWLHFDDPFTVDHLAALSYALPDMKGAFWKVQTLSEGETNVALQQPAYKLLNIPNQHLFKSILDYTSISKKIIQTSTTWLDHDTIPTIAKGIGLNSQSVHFAIALLPLTDEAALQWGNITYGLAWYNAWRRSIRLDRPGIYNPDTDYIERPAEIVNVESLLLNYLRMTLHIGGIPCLPVSDVDAQTGWLFFGSSSLLEQIIPSITPTGTAYSDAEFGYYYKHNEPRIVHYMPSL